MRPPDNQSRPWYLVPLDLAVFAGAALIFSAPFLGPLNAFMSRQPGDTVMFTVSIGVLFTAAFALAGGVLVGGGTMIFRAYWKRRGETK